MKAYSEDLRIRVLAALDGEMSVAQVARTFQISGRPRRIGPSAETRLRAQLNASPDATLPEHVSSWTHEQGASLSRWTMSRAIARLRVSRKKRV